MNIVDDKYEKLNDDETSIAADHTFLCYILDKCDDVEDIWRLNLIKEKLESHDTYKKMNEKLLKRNKNV